MSRSHIVTFEQKLPISVEHAWEFFSMPRNLARITPPDMRFEILSTDIDRPIFNGMQIEYRVRPMLGIATRWLTEINDVKAPHAFTDSQLKGPFEKWVHTHSFQATDDAVLMTDRVEYALPLGPIGELAHALLVRRRVCSIFEYREAVLRTIFVGT